MKTHGVNPYSDFLWNFVRFYLEDRYKVNLTPIRYKDDSAFFSVDLNVQDKLKVDKDLIDLLDSLDGVDYLIPLQDPRCLYFNHSPRLEKGVFFYNPFGEILKGLNKTIIKQLIAKIALSYKLKALKVLI